MEANPEQQVITTKQVRPAGQAGYPISLVASLDTVPVKWCVPLLQFGKAVKQHSRKTRRQKREVTSRKLKQWKKRHQVEVLHLFRCSTHLIRTIFANSDVECIVRAKTLQLYLTGMGRWHALRKYRKGTIAIANARSKKLEADPSLVTRTFNWARSFPSDIDLKFIGSSMDWNLWKKRQWTNDIKWNGMVVLGLATSHCRNDMKNSRYVDDRPHRYHRWHTGVFVGASPVCIPGTPCNDC